MNPPGTAPPSDAEQKEETLNDPTNFKIPHPRIPGKTVFLLGAGFSAPMGMPVMSRFVSEGLAILKKSAWHDYEADENRINKLRTTALQWMREELKLKGVSDLDFQCITDKVFWKEEEKCGNMLACVLTDVKDELMRRLGKVWNLEAKTTRERELHRERSKLIGKMEELLKRYLPFFTGREKDEPSLEDLYCAVDLFSERPPPEYQNEDRNTLCNFIREVVDLTWREHLEQLEHVREHNSDPHRLVPTVAQSCFHTRARIAYDESLEQKHDRNSVRKAPPTPGEPLPRNKSEVCIYRAFLSQFFSKRITAPKSLQECARDYANSAVITLNYDLIIEKKARDFGDTLRIFYGRRVLDPQCKHEGGDDGEPKWLISEDDVRKGTKEARYNGVVLPLIKLHGSLNWKFIRDHNDSNSTRHVHLENDGQCGTSCSTNDKCLIYPTWQRDLLGGTVFDALFSEARIHLRLASKIVIIGYSLPDTDRYLNYLLADVVTTPEMPDIEICNPGDAEEWRKRARKIFGDRLASHKLTIRSGLAEYVRSISDPEAPAIEWDSGKA